MVAQSVLHTMNATQNWMKAGNTGGKRRQTDQLNQPEKYLAPWPLPHDCHEHDANGSSTCSSFKNMALVQHRLRDNADCAIRGQASPRIEGGFQKAFVNGRRKRPKAMSHDSRKALTCALLFGAFNSVVNTDQAGASKVEKQLYVSWARPYKSA